MVGRGGWLRLPQEFLERAGIGSRAAASLEDGRIVVSAAGGDGVRPEPELAPLRRRSRRARPSPCCAESSRRTATGRPPRASSPASTPSSAGARVTAVTGPSGSGKTTLLHLLAGLDLPDAGEVLVGDTAVNALDRPARAELRRREVALVAAAERPRPVPERARERRARARRSAGSTGDPHEALASVGLAERAGQRVSRLSAGEQVRVAVARALAARPALLLVDEPTARLDQANALAAGGAAHDARARDGRGGRLRHARPGRDRAGRRRAGAGRGAGRSRLSTWKGSASRSSSSRRATTACRSRRCATPVTPVGLHYLLIHYDIPVVDAGDWRLTVARVERELALVARRPARAARRRARRDDGVRRQRPRPARAAAGQPAVAARGGRHGALARHAARAAARGGRRRRTAPSRCSSPGSTAAIEGGEEQAFQRSLPLDEAHARRGAARLRDERRAAAAAARLPAAPGRPGLVRDDERQVARRGSTVLDRAVRRLPATRRATGCAQTEDDEGEPLHADAAALADRPARDPGVPDARAHGRGRRGARSRAAPGRACAPIDVGRGQRRRRRDLGARPSSSPTRRAAGPGAAGRYRWDAEPGEYVLCSRARDEAGNEQPLEPPWNLGGYANNAVQRIPVTVSG